MTTPEFRLGLVQLTSIDNLETNFAQVAAAYVAAAAQGAQLVVTPENSLFFRIQSGSKLQSPGASMWQRLSALVHQHRAALMVTTAMENSGAGFDNATVLLQPEAEPRVVYRKIHLFDVDVPGSPPVRESEHFRAGDQPAVIEIDGWKFGLTICYDLRFAELFLRYAQQVDAILVPSAFLVPTGQAHWEVLLRARAIEAQTFVIAPAQSGTHVAGEQKRQTYGHSLAIDPWGRILVEVASDARLAVVTLKRDEIDKVRRQIPMAAHRRLKPV